MARTIDKVGCKEKDVPTRVEPEASTGIFPTPWQYPVPPKTRTAACDKCVDVDTFSHRLGPHKDEPSLRPMYAKETKRDVQRQRRVVDTLIIHQGRLHISRLRTAHMVVLSFRNHLSVVPS